jgi:hypothetical protein
MNTETHLKEVLKRLNKVVKLYADSLDQYSPEQLRYKQNEERWSLGQMFDHVIYAALEIYYPSVLTCINQPEPNAAGKTAAGIEIFERGEYPPLKVKTTHLPKNVDDKDFLYDGLKKILEQASILLPTVSHSSEKAKITHPRLGALHAKEWFELSELHMRHHLHQKKELEEILGIYIHI